MTSTNVISRRPSSVARSLGALLVIVAVGLAALCWPSAASAQTDASCDQVVIDRSGTIADTAALTARAEETGRDLDARVRVRIEPQVDGADADRYEAGLETACPSWRDGNERAKDLLVVVLITQDRKTGVYYGADLANSLQNRYLPVQNETMNPAFKEGDFAAGLDAGLSRLANGTGPGSDTNVVAVVVIALVVFVGAVLFVGLMVLVGRSRGGKGGGAPKGDGNPAATSAATMAAMSSVTTTSVAGGGSTSW